MAEKPAKLSTCRSCGEYIVWVKTERGKNMTVDADSFTDGEDRIFNSATGHISHFATCKDPVKWLKISHV